MRVWELEEGKEYEVIDMYSTMACEKYRINNGILESFTYGVWGGSSWDNRIDILKDLNFEPYTTPPTDWSKVEVDTKLLIDGVVRRYFAKYKDGVIYTFRNGATSWGSNETFSSSSLVSWDKSRVKLYIES